MCVGGIDGVCESVCMIVGSDGLCDYADLVLVCVCVCLRVWDVRESLCGGVGLM